MRWQWKIFWLLLFIVGATAEIIALWTVRGGDTLTDLVREATQGWFAWLALAGFLGWLAKHWLFDKRGRL